MKTNQFRVRLNEDNSQCLRFLANESGSSPIEIATMLLHSALLAVRDAKGTSPFPVRFEVKKMEIEEPKTPKQK